MKIFQLHVIYSWYRVVDNCKWLTETDMQKKKKHLRRQFPLYIRFVFPKLLRNPTRHLFITPTQLRSLLYNVSVHV